MSIRAFLSLAACLVTPAAVRTTGTPVPPAASGAASRTFVVQQVNGRPLPFADRFSTTGGWEHRIWLERHLVRLDPNGTFVMTVAGAYKDAPQFMPVGPNGGAGEVRDESVRGRWTRQGQSVVLTPAPSKRGKQYAPATGTLAGDRLVLRYEIHWDYGGHSGSRRYVLSAAYDPSYL